MVTLCVGEMETVKSYKWSSMPKRKRRLERLRLCLLSTSSQISILFAATNLNTLKTLYREREAHIKVSYFTAEEKEGRERRIYLLD
jgi:hypothetical protein